MILCTALCFCTVVAVTLRFVLNSYICVTSGIHLHKMMFKAILHAPIRFFDTNPSGMMIHVTYMIIAITTIVV